MTQQYDNVYISRLLDWYGPLLTEKQREYLECYYNDDLSLSEVADNFGVTSQGAHDIISRARNKLINTENKLGLMARFGDVEVENGI
ncbi:MAG: hypothetical protein LBN00_06830 [Oscillospiraceae bacterium]|jgi:predicted DNA-binding protein YlxM (UPF0122 family)|nr:hypothetical protein [Oscillospiraceae bacterium]